MQPEILVTTLEYMDVKDVLKMSLVFPELFDESMWRRLCPSWDYYSFLAEPNFRKRFAEIAIRKSLLKAKSVKRQIWFALLNQRKDLLQDFCEERAFSVKTVCDGLSYESNIYFNRSMINFAYQTLGYVVSDREKVIADFATSTEKASLDDVDYIRMCFLTRDDSVYRKWAEREGIVTDDHKACFVDSVLQGDNKEMWFFIYSLTQERDILEKIFAASKVEDISSSGRKDILANLYRSNHIGLARRFGNKFSLVFDLDMVLSCLTDYYFNTGDERGTYESLLLLGQGKPVFSQVGALKWKNAMLCSIASRKKLF